MTVNIIYPMVINHKEISGVIGTTLSCSPEAWNDGLDIIPLKMAELFRLMKYSKLPEYIEYILTC